MKRLIVLFLSSLLVAGCTGIPSAGPVKFGDQINGMNADQFIQVIGRPPTIGMSQTEIVTGFLAALADSRNDYSIARKYLLPEISKTWKTETGVSVYETTGLTVTEAGEQVNLSAGKFGEIDSTGYLTIAAPSSQLSQSFGIAKDAQGQWRISKLTDGILLSAGDVERSFNGYPIYFLTPGKTGLVADTVLVPQTITGSATALVQALLSGPSSKLSLATLNAFPTGTKLSYGSVPVTDGVATVDLTNQVLSADQITRSHLSAQLVWTLNSLPNVSSVEIKVSGQPLSVTGVANLQSTKDWIGYNPVQFSGLETMHYINQNNVMSIDLKGETKTVVAMPQTFTGKLGAVSGLVDGTGVAAVSSDGKQIFASTGRGGEFAKVATGSALSTPTLDSNGNIYFADYGSGIQKLNSKRQLVPVTFDSTNVGTEKQVKQIAVAKDGVRVALVISDGSVDQLIVGAIVSNDLITRIVGLHYVDRSIDSIRDITWQTPTSIAVLGSDDSGGNMIFDIDLATGLSTSISAPLSAQRVATSLAKQLYVGTVNGETMSIAKSSGSLWTDVTAGYSPYFSE